MIHSYDEIYTAKAQTSLAQMLRYAEEDLHIGLNEFWDMFLISGVADLFGKGDFRFLVGMSGVEAAWEVVWRLTGEWPQAKPTFSLDKSPTYWTGWILAWYQWYSGQSFRRINEFLTGISQSELARQSGVSVRMIQNYEQRQKDLRKAQTMTTWMLARALRCSVEDLMEY